MMRALSCILTGAALGAMAGLAVAGLIHAGAIFMVWGWVDVDLAGYRMLALFGGIAGTAMSYIYGSWS